MMPVDNDGDDDDDDGQSKLIFHNEMQDFDDNIVDLKGHQVDQG